MYIWRQVARHALETFRILKESLGKNFQGLVGVSLCLGTSNRAIPQHVHVPCHAAILFEGRRRIPYHARNQIRLLTKALQAED